MSGVIALCLAAILLIFGLILLDELYTTTTTDNSGSADNETLTTVTATDGENVANIGLCGFSMTVNEMTNATGGEAIPSSNYTASGGNINATSDSVWAGTNWNISYSYTYGLEACEASNETIVGTGKFADYFDLIVLAIVITVIISIIITTFAMKRVS